MDRAKWQRTVSEKMTATDHQILQMLEKDGLLPKWNGNQCPHCWKDSLRRAVHQGLPKYRCSKGCFVVPHYLHPIFQVSSGQQHQLLQVQAALLLLLLVGSSHAQCGLILGVNHKMTEGMTSRLASLRQRHVEENEKHMTFGNGKRWTDVDADEAILLSL